jgi:glycosyltransferase involved in cell wall biosynthesis
MKILLANFAECPENLHFEQALIRALRRRKNVRLDIVHDFRFPYSFIEREAPPGGGRRLHCTGLTALKRAVSGPYDRLISLDFPKRKACAAPFLWLAKELPCSDKIFIANHLLPMPGHNPTADIARRLGLLGAFGRIVTLEFDDKELWLELGARRERIAERGYAVDCRYYTPGGSPGDYIFTAGSAGRDFTAPALAAKRAGLRLKVFSDSAMPQLPPEVRASVSACPLSRNLHNLRQAIRESRAVVIPVSDKHINEAAGNSIAFLAMACGRPVIIKRTPYFERFIKDGVNGFFYSSLSPLSLARQLNRVLAMTPAASRRLARAARASVLKRASLVLEGTLFTIEPHLNNALPGRADLGARQGTRSAA